ncbi:MAG: TonB-dependent receptor plug domain-containing protein [Bacteroidota bacterium]
MRSCSLGIILYLTFSLGCFAQAASEKSTQEDDPRVARIEGQLKDYYNTFQQEKVFLHLDKETYSIDEQIWYKAYLVNATTHIPEARSTNLYIEVTNSDREMFQLQRLNVNNGYAHGDMSLPDTISSGYYHIRAYTAWMTNFDRTLIPSYTVYISNPHYQKYFTHEEKRIYKRKNKKNKKAEEEIELFFFPEGGLFIQGLQNTIGFKAVNGLGLGVDVKGAIYTNSGKKVAEFGSLYKGIGRFNLLPGEENYYAIVEGYKKKFGLPEPLPSGTVMTIDNTEPETLQLTIRSNRPLSNDPNATDVILLAHTRGVSRYHKVLSLHDAPLTMEIPKSLFPARITHFTMFNGRGLPLGERLVFISHPDEKINYTFEQNMSESYYNRATFNIKATDHEGKPLKTNFSLAVPPGINKNTNPFKASIVSTLLLTSDVKGNIENPEYYLTKNEVSQKALDNLLLTQGWRRFLWQDIIEERGAEIVNEREKGISLTGRITREFFNIPYPDAKVELVILNEYNDFYTTYSDEEGYFRFDNLNYPDTIHLQIRAYKPNGKRNLLIHLEEGDLPDVTLPKKDYNRIIPGKAYPEYLVKHRLEKEGKIGPIDYRPEKEKDAGYHRIHSNPDYVLTEKDIPAGYSNLFQVLTGRVPGVTVNGQSVTIRGPSSILMSNEPLYLIDGVPTDANGVASLNPNDVARIEIISGSGSAIYGSQGGNGVIAIYTKRGEFMKKGFLEMSMLGYYTAREFYQPKLSKYKTIEEFETDSPTIYWNPNLATDEYGEATVQFEIPELTMPVKLEIQGISNDGLPGNGEHTLILH